MNDADALPTAVAARERFCVTYSRHLLASAEDLVHCSRGHHAKLKSRKAPHAGIEAPDHKGQRREGTRHSTNVSPAAGSPGRTRKGQFGHGQNTVLGWSDPTFAHDCVAKVSRGSLQPNKKLLLVRGVRIWAKQVQKVRTTPCTFVFTCFFTPSSAQFL